MDSHALEKELTCSHLSQEDFTIKKEINRGNFSVVFEAHWKSVDQAVALKKLQIQAIKDAKTRQDCIKEIYLLQKLNHPNIIQYFASFIEDEELFIVLELADGGDLSVIIAMAGLEQKLFPELLIWNYFAQLCAALQHMHARRIMHRDIKPSNVFITSHGILKLGDLGLGRFFSSQTLDAFSLVGTPYYMSPERMHSFGYNFKSDIWSLGCLLYEMMALQNPFEGGSFYILCKKIEHCDYPPIPADHYYSKELGCIVDKCLCTTPSQRPDIDSLYTQAKNVAFPDHSLDMMTSSRSVTNNSDRRQVDELCISN